MSAIHHKLYEYNIIMETISGKAIKYNCIAFSRSIQYCDLPTDINCIAHKRAIPVVLDLNIQR